MKTIILSFDDARSDFYSRAFPIMQKYGIPSTLNIITNYMRDMDGHSKITCSNYSVGINREELKECHKSGLVEIACHGAHHQNTRKDIEQNITALINLGIDDFPLGFASPNSELTEQNKNDDGIWNLVEEKKLLYIRSGIQIRREGYAYSALSLLDRYIHSKFLFWHLNYKNIITDSRYSKTHILPSVTIFSYTTLQQIKYLIKKMEDTSIVILMFHSILQTGDNGYGKDKFYWDVDNFDSLCAYLKSQNDIQVSMTKEIFN